MPFTVYFGIVCGIMHEIGHRIKMLLSLSVTDPLTKLHNRKYIDLNFCNIIEDAHKNNTNLTIALIDADNFGIINKKYGHQVGDFVLQEMAKRFKDSIWPSDLCARYGGEEFVIIMQNTNLTAAQQTAERLRNIIAESPIAVDMDPYDVPITVSIGLACIEPSDTRQSLVSRADHALSIAKASGKNCVVAHNANFSTPLHMLSS